MRNFEKHIQSAADSFEMEPAEGSFDQVMKALEKKKKRRFLFWIWFLVPGTVSAAVLIGLFLPGENKSQALLHTRKRVYVNCISTRDIPQKKAPNFTDKQEIIKQDFDRITSNVNATSGPETSPINKLHTKTTHREFSQVVVENQDISPETNKNEFLRDPQKDEEKNNQVPDLIVPLANSQVLLPFTSNPYWNLLPLPKFKHKIPSATIPVSKFSIGAYTQLGVMKSMYINNADSAGEVYTHNREETDKYLFSWTAGISFRYSPKPWLALETGIGYSRYSSSQWIGSANISSTTDLTLPDSAYTFGNNIFPATANKQEFINDYDYLSIPLKIYFQKKWKWIGIEGGVGLSMDIPVYTRSFTMQPDNSISTYTTSVSESKLSTFGLLVSTQAHAVFHIKKWSLYLGPVFKIRATNMYREDYIIKQYYYFIGAETGIRYNF